MDVENMKKQIQEAFDKDRAEQEKKTVSQRLENIEDFMATQVEINKRLLSMLGSSEEDV